MTLLDSPVVRSVVPVPAIRLDELLPIVNGRFHGQTPITTPTPSIAVTGASVDSRRVERGNLFVALAGERTDGHAHVAEAFRAGAAAALVSRPVDLPSDVDGVLIRVADPLVALQELAAWWRSRHAVRVVGITGSTGKTMAKEMTADLLSRKLVTLRNAGNLNSETGLPMTLLRLDASHEAAVLEMSMYTVGEIARLAEIAHPEVGIVLAVHPTHVERAGSVAQIARGKAELPAALPADGLAILNADDPRVAAMARVTPAPVRTFGLGAGADVRAVEVTSHGLVGTEFTLVAPWGSHRLRSATPGRHLVPHALAAATAADHLGVPMPEIEAGLAAGSHAEHRMAVGEAASGATLVDDTYNASPVSVAAALDFLAETSIGNGRRRLAVLGDMLELGPDSEAHHRAIGARAGRALDGLVAVGERGRLIAEAAGEAGLARVSWAGDADEAASVLERELAPGPGDLVLVKASRGVGLDRTVDLLRRPGP